MRSLLERARGAVLVRAAPLDNHPPSVVWASQERERWSGRVTFLLAAIGSAVGLGNLWRFPYLSYKHGGGAFMVPYLLSLFVLGIPVLLLELGLGQVFQGERGVRVVTYARFSPILDGTSRVRWYRNAAPASRLRRRVPETFAPSEAVRCVTKGPLLYRRACTELRFLC